MEDWYTPTRIWMAALLGLSYAIPAGVAFLKWDSLRDAESRKELRRLWLAIAGILAGLTAAIWSQAPHFLETWGRDSLIEGGVWENRRPMQAAVIGLIALATIAVCGWVLLRSRADWSARLLFVGALAVACETIIAAVSFHYIDSILNCQIAPHIRVSALVKMSGIVWIWACTAAASAGLLRGKTGARANRRKWS
jgi:hypothetical protein